MRAEEAAGGAKPPAGSPGLLRSRLTPSKPQDNVARARAVRTSGPGDDAKPAEPNRG